MMISSLTLSTIIVGVVAFVSFTEGRSALPSGSLVKKGYLNGLKKRLLDLGVDSRVKRAATEFRVYTCPLDLTGKKCTKRKRAWRWPYFPYGVKHSYIQIGTMCYDWGDWNYPRSITCTDKEISCCTNDGTRQYTGYTQCASRVGDFESAWTAEGSSYNILLWNCQRYTDAMKDFLNNCHSNADDAIP